MKASDMPSAATSDAGRTSPANEPSGLTGASQFMSTARMTGPATVVVFGPNLASARDARTTMPIMISSVIGSRAAPLGKAAWVFNSYVVALGGLLLLGGKLADLFGARRIFSLGWVVLLAGSAIAGAAGDVEVELIGRSVQGAGSALIAPSALTLLMMLFGHNPRGVHDDHELGRGDCR